MGMRPFLSASTLVAHLETDVVVTVEMLEVVVVTEIVAVCVTNAETVVGGGTGAVAPSSMSSRRKLKLSPWPAGTFTART